MNVTKYVPPLLTFLLLLVCLIINTGTPLLTQNTSPTPNTSTTSNTPNTPPISPLSGLISMLFPFALMFLVLYLLIIRPQQKKDKERLLMLNSLKKNDYVLTSGGIYGTITNIKDNEIILKIDEDVKVKIAKTAIIAVITRSKDNTDNSKEQIKK